MKTAKEYVDTINAAKVCAPHYLEGVIDMGGVEEITVLIHDEYRWYVIGTTVFKVGDEFFGVRGPVALKSEAMGYKDVDWECTAFEMVAVPSVTYKVK